ncbi:dienelactone hydrolase family protein [bacterium]|nr:MAG: dienelactone hydrolase family protein [bacterium]
MASAKIVTKNVSYQSGDVQCEGFMAYDDKFEGKRPAILIAHQWMGLTDYEKTRAVQLASGGFVTFALDLYGKANRPKNMDEAKTQSSAMKADRTLWRARANDALKTLQQQPNVDTSKIVAIGYCMGGGTALELGRSGADVKGIVSFHGSLDTPTPEDAKNIKGKVLVLHGASDPAAPMSTVLGLSDEMTKAGVDFQVVLYGGAVHSFTQREAGNDPSKGSAYNADADRRSFVALQVFLDELFGG